MDPKDTPDIELCHDLGCSDDQDKDELPNQLLLS